MTDIEVQRRFPRYSATLEVLVQWKDQPMIECHSKNISEGGLFLWLGEQTPAEGTNLSLELRLPGNDAGIPVTGVVCYSVEEMGAGVRFDEPSGAPLTRLRDWVEKAKHGLI